MLLSYFSNSQMKQQLWHDSRLWEPLRSPQLTPAGGSQAGRHQHPELPSPQLRLMDKLCPHLTHSPASERLCPPHKLCPPTPSLQGLFLSAFILLSQMSLPAPQVALPVLGDFCPVAMGCCCFWNKQSVSATQGQSGGQDIHSAQRPHLILQFLEQSIRGRIRYRLQALKITH